MRRLQGSGILTGILKDIDEDDPETDGDIQDLILSIKEDPQHTTTKDLKDLYTTYEAFRKLYRKNTSYDKNMYNILVDKLWFILYNIIILMSIEKNVAIRLNLLKNKQKISAAIFFMYPRPPDRVDAPRSGLS